MQAILNKLYKAKSEKTKAVKLSIMDSLQTDVDNMYNGMKDAANDAMDGIGKLEQSLGFLQGYIENVKELRTVKNDLIAEVLDLGIDIPQKLDNVDNEIEAILMFDDFESQNDKLQEIKTLVQDVFIIK